MARILVVDDESNIRMMIRFALEHSGHIVGLAIDGQEGLRMYGSGEEWDLVLLDQRMPGMEGLEVLKEIRKRSPYERIIMITAFGTVDLAVNAMKAGATDFLRKPFTTDVLRGAVRAALNERPEGGAPERAGITYGMTTLNGFHIEYRPGEGKRVGGGLQFDFTVRNPEGLSKPCEVTLPPVIMELVKAHADLERVPYGNRFWESICEEWLANYLWQQSDFPPAEGLTVDDLTSGLRKFIDTILSMENASAS